MLIQFKVANFRSIREEQTLSLVANNADKNLVDECLIDRTLPALKGTKFLKGAALYGANASGKSNVLNAIQFVKNFVANSATTLQPDAPTGAEPFKLDRDSSAKPSVFEMTFVVDDVRYVFGLSVTRERVMEEFLIAYPKGVPQKWYRRVYSEETKKYEWGRPSTHFKHDKSLQEKTRANSAFLSVGPQFNHPQLTPIYNWFNNHIHFLFLSESNGILPNFTAQQISTSSYSPHILNLLKSADIGVVDANVRTIEVDVEKMGDVFTANVVANIKQQHGPKLKATEIKLIHQADGMDPVSFDFIKEESAGTRRLFALAGPWTDILDNGYTVFIDEIESSLHPLLVKELLKLLFSKTHNPKGAQVIFTTHNPILLDTELLRRDQIWFTEKAPNGATHLYPLTDYQPRDTEALAKGYLAGRYGAIPFIPEGLKI